MPSLPPALVAALRQACPDRDFLLISAGISRKLHRDLTVLIADGKKHPRCTVFLCTLGGDSDAGYRIARCLQHHYEHIRLVVPSYCKSAGTLIAIGANELAIGDLGELGPLDMQVAKPTELHEHGSVLDLIEALNSTQSHIIDPGRLGAIQRAMNVVNHYGERLNQTSKILFPHALENLIGAYPSHSFVIDRDEAAELFRNVQCPNQNELNVFLHLWELLKEPAQIPPSFITGE